MVKKYLLLARLANLVTFVLGCFYWPPQDPSQSVGSWLIERPQYTAVGYRLNLWPHFLVYHLFGQLTTPLPSLQPPPLASASALPSWSMKCWLAAFSELALSLNISFVECKLKLYPAYNELGYVFHTSPSDRYTQWRTVLMCCILVSKQQKQIGIINQGNKYSSHCCSICLVP